MGHAKRNHPIGSFYPEDQDHCSSRAQVLRLDRWFHPGLSVHLPVHVDHQGGVRRVRPRHRPPQVLLNPTRLGGVRLSAKRKKQFCLNDYDNSDTHPELPYSSFEPSSTTSTVHAKRKPFITVTHCKIYVM